MKFEDTFKKIISEEIGEDFETNQNPNRAKEMEPLLVAIASKYIDNSWTTASAEEKANAKKTIKILKHDYFNGKDTFEVEAIWHPDAETAKSVEEGTTERSVWEISIEDKSEI